MCVCPFFPWQPRAYSSQALLSSHLLWRNQKIFPGPKKHSETIISLGPRPQIPIAILNRKHSVKCGKNKCIYLPPLPGKGHKNYGKERIKHIPAKKKTIREIRVTKFCKLKSKWTSDNWLRANLRKIKPQLAEGKSQKQADLDDRRLKNWGYFIPLKESAEAWKPKDFFKIYIIYII